MRVQIPPDPRDPYFRRVTASEVRVFAIWFTQHERGRDMARRIRIKRNKRPEVLRMSGKKFPRDSFGAGTTDPDRHYWCLWCYYPKETVKEKCGCCGKFGATNMPQKEISQVYLEDNPVFESR
jgi:hypothetical protein